MSSHTIATEFGRAEVLVHRLAGACMAMLVGWHLVPARLP